MRLVSSAAKDATITVRVGAAEIQVRPGFDGESRRWWLAWARSRGDRARFADPPWRWSRWTCGRGEQLPEGRHTTHLLRYWVGQEPPARGGDQVGHAGVDHTIALGAVQAGRVTVAEHG